MVDPQQAEAARQQQDAQAEAQRLAYEQRLQQMYTLSDEQAEAIGESQERAKDKFYERWPQLRGKDERVLVTIANANRMVNPQATEEQLIEQVGLQAMLHFKVPPENAQPADPAAPAQSSNVAPFKPAAPGAGAKVGAKPPAPPKKGQMQEFFEQLDAEDE